MNTPTPDRKKLVYGTQKTLDREVGKWQGKGWRLAMSQICYGANGKKTFIAELVKE